MARTVSCMKRIDFYKIVEKCAEELYIRALKKLPQDVKGALSKAYKAETSTIGKKILGTISENVRVAEREDNLLCQDTGLPVYFIEVGTKLDINIPRLKSCITEGCRTATENYPLRSNTLHTITRDRTFTNTGRGIPVLHIDFIPNSDILAVTMVPKGSGSENMSFLKMLTPAEGIAGVKKFIISSVIEAGANPCPPTVIGVGLGGTSDVAMLLAKKAIARPIGSGNEEPLIMDMEEELLQAINKLGIGPMGLGGDTTALAVHIENADTHITLNPVAVNFQCWAARRATAKIYKNGEVEHIG